MYTLDAKSICLSRSGGGMVGEKVVGRRIEVKLLVGGALPVLSGCCDGHSTPLGHGEEAGGRRNAKESPTGEPLSVLCTTLRPPFGFSDAEYSSPLSFGCGRAGSSGDFQSSPWLKALSSGTAPALSQSSWRGGRLTTSNFC